MELHLLQNFAPSNLNRDDTGAPKQCLFGGYVRARISSQCMKRAARTYVRREGLIREEYLSKRSRRFVQDLADRLVARGKDSDDSKRVVENALAALKIKVDPKREQTEYLLFLGDGEADRIADLCARYWDDLVALSSSGESKGARREAKKAAKSVVPPELKSALERVFDGAKAADLAMFGRMLADFPAGNREAASQVAHAISTHVASREVDYFTAVDDIPVAHDSDVDEQEDDQDGAGAGMIGTVEFNSACYYRYSNVDVRLLEQTNLLGDRELARRTLGAFLLAQVLAVPSGKQNSMAAPNPPVFAMTVVRDSGLWSLAGAFEKPVRPFANDSIVERSVHELDNHYGQLQSMYGEYSRISRVYVSTIYPHCLDALKPNLVRDLPALLTATLEAAFPGSGSEIA